MTLTDVESPVLAARFAAATAGGGVALDAYSKAVSQTFASPSDAFEHYLAAGRTAAPELFPFIETAWYASQLASLSPPLEIPATVTPFDHYVTIGARHEVSPMPLFDPLYVRAQNPQLAAIDVFDFLFNPAFVNTDPHPFFSKRGYSAINTDVASAGLDPFAHFVHSGWRERRVIHPFLGPDQYRRLGFPADSDWTTFQNCLAAAFANPALSSKQPLFDPAHYARSLASCGQAEPIGAPLQHYLTTGWRKNASPFPLFDPAHFLGQQPAVRTGVAPYVEYLSDFSHACSPHALFDPAHYQQSVTTNLLPNISLLEHFVRWGAADGLSPHPRVIVAPAFPSRYSGLAAACAFPDASGRTMWLCVLRDPDRLRHELADIHQFEPALNAHLLQDLRLHPASNPLSGFDRSLMATTIRCARCHCLSVSLSPLREDLTAALLSPSLLLATSARPWLTLLSCAPGMVRYWHMFYGPKAAADCHVPADLPRAALFVAQLVTSALPDNLVVKTDPLGVALLRNHGPQILGPPSRVSLLLDSRDLDPDDRRWMSEFIAVRYAEFASLLVHHWDDPVSVAGWKADGLAAGPRVTVL